KNTSAHEQFLQDARNGNLEGIQKLLMSKIKDETKIDINCKNRSNFGWTPLHLACYFGHKDVVEELLKAGADANLTNNVGDTPLHKAAFTGRKEVVMLLLQYDACASVINGTAQIPKDITHNEEIRSMLEAAERTEERKLAEQLLESAREGATTTLLKLLNGEKPPNINCTDLLGNTPLHCAAYRGQKQCAVKLLHNGANPNIRNKNGQTAFDLVKDTEMKQILEGNVMKVSSAVQLHPNEDCVPSTRFFRWRSYWVVLQDGVLSWYSKQPDAASNGQRQGCKPLTRAQCKSCYFTLKCFDDSIHHFKVSPKDDPEAARKKWLEAIEEHSAFSTHYCSQEQISEEDEDERMSLCELTDSLQVHNLKLEQEVEKNKILAEALQALATEHHDLEQSVVRGSSPRSAVVSEDDFYDALSGYARSCLAGRMSQEDLQCTHPSVFCFWSFPRTSLPAQMFSRNDFSIWSILRKCIGMELSKITMPVIFNEPLSFLQRLTEYMEHTHLIHQANVSTDSTERMKCVAAFTVSAVASQWERTGKPFNPLLGETYELVREDLGFRLASEQVSHHPPVSAFHAEGLQKDFVFHGSIYPKLKFWGKSVEAEPKGIMTLELPKYNEAYTWTNPTCCVHNIIVGQLWIEQYGNVEVINHRTGEKCFLTFKPCGLFGKELHKVEGYITDKSKKKVCMLYGKWTECMYAVDPATFEVHKKNEKKVAEEKKSSKQGTSVDAEESPQPGSDSLDVIPGSQLLWRISPRPANSAQMYSFTSFAMQLNELDEETEAVIPKTDCRLRPDIRAMENGDIDMASEEKKRLEEKQRAARKGRSKPEEECKTRWFQQGSNPYTDGPDWLFSTAYWNRDYSQVPDIY
uniref:Oxysterol-binding protein n=1 Tax=Electrophorus electricus TaxID=8005 RepID=A0A4W4G2R0_ELEEL